MSELWICREKKAEEPFRLRASGWELRTVEELCYYLYHNIDHLEEEAIGQQLFDWMARELELPRLASSMEQQLRQGKHAVWCAWFLLKEIGMYSEEELLEIRALCLAMEDKDELEWQKLRADRLLQNEKYVQSIKTYAGLLRICQEQNRKGSFPGSIWHNMAVAHARLFMFQEAAQYFEKAYELNQRKESYEALREARRMLEEWEAPKDQETEEPQDWMAYLTQLREDYKKKVM